MQRKFKTMQHAPATKQYPWKPPAQGLRQATMARPCSFYMHHAALPKQLPCIQRQGDTSILVEGQSPWLKLLTEPSRSLLHICATMHNTESDCFRQCRSRLNTQCPKIDPGQPRNGFSVLKEC